ncbi:MAG: DNA topoisomerase I [Candidatus Pacearchaeota archaeon]
MIELIIAEKPKAALKIAQALGKAKIKNILGVKVYEIEREGKKIIIASAVGHLFILAETKKEGWPTFNFDFKPIYQVTKQKYTLKYINVLKKLKPEKIIIATDYDIEGELIGYNILRYIYNTNNAYRMKFSTLTRSELIKAYENKLPNIDFNQAIAGETRHKLDWIYGINLSRLLINASKKILSIGRVQGPTLNLIAERENQIANFKPEKYYAISLIVKDKNGNKITLDCKEKIKDKDELKKFELLKNKEIKLKIKEKEKSILPLPPFNLTQLQLEAYRFFKFSPSKTLEIAQNLYLSGLISYPRTSSQKLPESIGYKKILENLAKLFKFKIKRDKPIEGKATDPAHPAIFPTGEIEEINKLNFYERKIYDLISRRFINCFYDDLLIKFKEIKTKIENLEFSKTFKKIKNKGWLEIYPYKIEETWTNIDENAYIEDIIIEEKETKPPKRYTPAALIKELEKRNLGTKATRAQIIDTLYKRGYIKGKAIKLTPLGYSVNELLKKISPLILDEALTRKFEIEMDRIMISDNPIKEENKILNEAKNVLISIAKEWENKKSKLRLLLENGLKKMKEEEIEKLKVDDCICGGILIIKKSKKGKNFISCTNWPECNIAIPLPKGKIKKSSKLCKCGKNLLEVKNKKLFFICFNQNCENFWLNKMKNKNETKNKNEK